jgi:sulfur-oxidizing protein SoxY
MFMADNPKKLELSRRDVLASAGAGLAALAAVAAAPRPASATVEDVQAAMSKLIGDKTPQEGRVAIKLPEIAENGNTVPLSIEVESPMSEADYVKAVHVFAEGNPRPDVASFRFTPRSGRALASTRMRLAKTQNVVAVAEMSDGSVYMAKRQVKVTIGGCGG